MRYVLGLFAGALALLSVAGSAFALSDADKAEVRTIIRDYLIENPEVIREAIEALETRQKEAEAKSRALALEEKKAAIFESKHQVELGNRKGDGADLAIIELLGSELEVKKAERAEKAKEKTSKKKEEKKDEKKG